MVYPSYCPEPAATLRRAGSRITPDRSLSETAADVRIAMRRRRREILEAFYSLRCQASMPSTADRSVLWRNHHVGHHL